MKIPRPAHCIENISVFLRLGMGRICAVVLVVIQRGLLVHIIDRSSSVDRILKRLRPVNDSLVLSLAGTGADVRGDYSLAFDVLC